MYAIVKTGGKQYRVEQGSSLLVERLPVDEGAKVSLEPLLFVDGKNVVDERDGLSKIKVEAKVLAHERGPKLRIVKFKPKRGYKRRTGHRQELTRIEVTALKPAAARATRSRSEPAAKPAAEPAAEPAAKPAIEPAAKPAAEAAAKPAPRRRAPAPKGDAPAPTRPRRTTTPRTATPRTTTPKKKEADDGS
jgi:large subunit ribosomal protein L21